MIANAGPIEKVRHNGRLDLALHLVAPLDAYSLIPYHASRLAWLPNTRFLYLKDSANAAPVRPFALRNFGIVRDSTTVRLAFDAVTGHRQDMSVDQTDRFGLLSLFIDHHGEMVAPRDLSQLHAPRSYDPQPTPHGDSFQLIVGDTVDDVALAWNRPLTSGGYARRDSLWLSSESARDNDLMKLVGRWIGRRFFSNQQRRGVVISHSEDIAFLCTLASALPAEAWIGFDAVRLNRGEFPFQARPFHSSLISGPGFGRALPHSEQVPLSNDDEVLLRIPRPEFLPQRTTGQAGWMVDLNIEYHHDPARFANHADYWRLPRRARFGHLFAPQPRMARIVRGGLPSVSVASEEQGFKLRIPSKRLVLFHLLEPTTKTDAPELVALGIGNSVFQDVRTSEQGRRLGGVISLFGSVYQAATIFRDEFWRDVLHSLAGKHRDDAQRQARTVEKVLRAAVQNRAGGTDLQEGEITAIARNAAGALHSMVKPAPTMTLNTLKGLFGRIHGRQTINTEDGDRPLKFGDWAQREFEWMLEAGILLQGLDLECPRCGLKQWRPADAIAAVVPCDGCATPFRLPPDPAWAFRLNELIGSAITRDGVLPLVDALNELSLGANDMALTILPQDLRKTRGGDKVTDLDIIVVRNGKFVIGEVKSSPDGVDDATIASLTEVAAILRPDVLVVAAVAQKWPAAVAARLEHLTAGLAPLGISVSPMLLEW